MVENMEIKSENAHEAFITAMPLVQQGYKVTNISWKQASYYSPNELCITLREED